MKVRMRHRVLKLILLYANTVPLSAFVLKNAIFDPYWASNYHAFVRTRASIARPYIECSLCRVVAFHWDEFSSHPVANQLRNVGATFSINSSYEVTSFMVYREYLSSKLNPTVFLKHGMILWPQTEPRWDKYTSLDSQFRLAQHSYWWKRSN